MALLLTCGDSYDYEDCVAGARQEWSKAEAEGFCSDPDLYGPNEGPQPY